MPPGPPFSSLKLEPSSTVDRAVEELRRALFDGELTPGTPLREVALSEALSVSRSTVREVLSVLVAEGLAQREPHRGVYVAALEPHAVRDVSRARAVLEIAGVRCWPEAPERARDAVREALGAYRIAAREPGSSWAELTAAHLDLHRALVGLTGSERLLGVAEGLTAELRLALAGVDRVRRNAGDQVHSHADLVRLLERGDVEGAVTELRSHLADAEASLLHTTGTTEQPS